MLRLLILPRGDTKGIVQDVFVVCLCDIVLGTEEDKEESEEGPGSNK